jgi:glycosyltransferase involved in cell wall biosynthesis
MRIVYLADTQIPSRATNGIQVMRMCAAFAHHGVDVTLVHPHRFGNRPEGFSDDVWSFYGVPESFRIVTLPTPLTLRLSDFKRFARFARGAPMASWVLGRSRPGAEPFVAYSRSMLGTWLALRARSFWGPRSACRGVYVEVHDAPVTQGGRETLANADGVIAISAALRKHLVAESPGLADRTWVAHDGVNRSLVDDPLPDQETARHRLGLALTSTVVGYTGRITLGKGIETVLAAAGLLKSESVHFLLVGKQYADVDADAARDLGNVTLAGFVPPPEVRSYVVASSMLVMPTSAQLPYARFTSPLKLFEYLASGRPVICSDLPVLREVVEHEVNALLFRSDDPHSLATSIERLRADPALGSKLARRARADVLEFTWERRAARILERTYGSLSSERCPSAS